MKKLLTAGVVGLTLATGGAFAQSNTGTMDVGLSMLELAASKEFAQLGITDVDPMALSLNQLSQIKSVMASSDYNNSEKKLQIEAILRNN